MSIRKVAAVVGGAAIAAVVATAASAWPAQTTGPLNVRTGPGVSYPKIGTLPPGTPVDVQQCQGSWCSVGSWGGSGWVSANYLAGTPGFVPPAPRHHRHRHHNGFFITVGPGGVLIGPNWPGPAPWPGPGPYPYPYAW